MANPDYRYRTTNRNTAGYTSTAPNAGVVAQRPPAYTPPKQTYVNPSPANQISKANAANPYNPPPPHVNPPPANLISQANAANPYNPPPVNNTAQQQAILAAQREAERQALLEAQRRAQEEAARRAQEEAARQAAIAAQRAQEEAARRAQEEAARQAALAAQRAQEERDRQATLAAQQQRDRLNAIVSQQKSTHENKKLEQINTSPTNKQSATYYWNIANVPTKYVNPVVANEISKANANIDRLEELKKWRRPPSTDVNQVQPILGQGLISSNLFPNVNVGLSAQRNDEEVYRQLQAQRQQYDNAEQVNAYLGYGNRGYPEAYSWRTTQLPTQGLATTGTAVNMTPGLANVEYINIPASTTVPNTASAAPAASTAAPLPTAAAYPEMYRYRTTNLNTAGYTSTAPAAGTIEKSAGTANEATIPKGAKKSRPSYGQSGQVVKAPYKVGGYTEAELKAMGNEARRDLVGPDGSMLFEGYYKAPDGNYYPVNQGKANYALARGMTDPSQYWYYYGYTPDKEAYRNVFGTYYGYTPSWRTTAYSNASGAGPVPAPKYAPSVPAPSGSTGAYGAGFSGVDITGQQRYFNPVINWSY